MCGSRYIGCGHSGKGGVKFWLRQRENVANFMLKHLRLGGKRDYETSEKLKKKKRNVSFVQEFHVPPEPLAHSLQPASYARARDT